MPMTTPTGKPKDAPFPPKNTPSTPTGSISTAWTVMPPAIPEAERALAAVILRSPNILDDLDIGPDDFSDPAVREIWAAMMTLFRRGEPVDSVSLAILLRESGSRYGSAEIAQILSYAPSGGARSLAAKIREYAQRRQIMQTMATAYTAAADQTVDMPHVIEPLAREVDGILAGRTDRQTQDVQAIMGAIMRDALHGIRVRPVLTPFPSLDRITGGLFSDELIVLAGRPGTGKTAMAGNVVMASMFAGRKVGMFSLEMSAAALVQRMAAAAQGIDAQAFRHGKYNQSDVAALKRFEMVVGRLAKEHGNPLRICDAPRIDPDMIRAECRTWKRKGGLDLVVIDYLQLIQPYATRKESTREREVAEITRALKQLAIEVAVPILLLAQLNRAVEARKDQTPILSDLRESGSIEQDADQVWFLTPWNAAQNDVDMVSVRLSVAKSRSSATGSVPLEYHRRHLRFQEVAA